MAPHSPSSPDNPELKLLPVDSPSRELPLGPELSHAIFRAEDFNPDRFLLSQRHTALDDLRTELRTYLAGLRAELVGLINEDYEDFIGLGMGLRGTVERAMGKMKAPVETAQQEIDKAKQQLEQERLGLEGLLNERRIVIDSKKLVRLMLNCGEAVSKVEDMLSITPPSLDPSLSPNHNKSIHTYLSQRKNPDKRSTRTAGLSHESVMDELHSIETGTKRIERTVSEFNQMLYLVSKGSGLAYVEGLKPRISHISHTLHLELASLLKNTLLAPKSDPRKKECLLECLRAYLNLGAPREAEQVIKNELVLPGLAKLIHRNSLNPGSISPILPKSPETTKFPRLHYPREAAQDTQNQPVLPALAKFRPIPIKPSSMSPVLPESSEATKLPPFYPPHSSPLPSSTTTKTPQPSTTSSNSLSFTPLSIPHDPTLIPLPLLYNKILAFIARDLSLPLELADRQLSNSKPSLPEPTSLPEKNNLPINRLTNPTYNLLTNAVVCPILSSITETLSPSGLFASGNPKTFHRNYSTTTQFLSQLESFCVSPRQVLDLRSAPDWAAFKSRWQLAVYAQIRTKEIIAVVEDGLLAGLEVAAAAPAVSSMNCSDGQDTSSSSSSGSQYKLKGTETIENVLTRLWHDDVFLMDLAHRFWRLTLMTISRYDTWLSTVTVSYISHTSSTASALAAPSNAPANSRSSSDLNRLGVSSPSNRSNTRPSTPQGDASGDEELLARMASIMADVGRLKINLAKLFKVSIEPKLPKVTIGPDGITPEDIITKMLAKIDSIIPPLTTSTTQLLIRRSTEKLRLIRSVGSSARASRTTPTEPSFFVSDIFSDLRHYLSSSSQNHPRSGGAGACLPSDLRLNLVDIVVEEISARYLSILLNVQRSEDSLRKLKKGRQGFSIFGNSSGAGKGTLNTAGLKGQANDDADESRVKIQMRLDVERLRRDALELGARVDQCKSLLELQRTVDAD